MKSKRLKFLLGMFCVFSIGISAQTFDGGEGTLSNPYIITTADHVQSMHQVDYSSEVYYRLEADVDMSGIEWEPLNYDGDYSNHMHFDGNGHVIKNLSSKGYNYASFFGVLCGSVKDLGIINADIESNNASGIIAGYAGLKGPDGPTGTVDNCYTTGSVSGDNAVGGIVGNIGKPNSIENTVSAVRNCYSAADVLATATGMARAGGIAGIVWSGGVLANSYATGNISSNGYGVGGIVGWTDSDISGCVALNETITNAEDGNIGRVAAFMGEVDGNIAQGVNCWALDEIILDNAGTVVAEGDFITGEVTVSKGSYDGETKTKDYLSDPMNYYSELEWDFASAENIWSQTMSNGFPIFQWLVDRGDYEDIDGHHDVGTFIASETRNTNNLNVFVQNKTVHVEASSAIDLVRVYDISGSLVFSENFESTSSASFELEKSGIYIIEASVDGKSYTQKLLYR